MDRNAVQRFLEAEQATIELELTDIGYLHAHNNGSIGAPKDITPEPEDLNEMADFDTAQETNKALAQNLLARAADIVLALARLEQGTYGTCTNCGLPIEPERLAAYMAASTCMTCASNAH